MSKIRIMSWNMQGGGSTPGKLDGLADEINRSTIPKIILLQESGTPDTPVHKGTGFNKGEEIVVSGNRWEREFVCVASVVDPSAKGLRCTLSVLIEQSIYDIWDIHCVEEDLFGNLRPVVSTQFLKKGKTEGDFVISNYHATANGSTAVSETKANMRNLEKKYNGQWLLAGDFNSEPGDYIGKDAFPKICSGLKTQGPRGTRVRELDYAMVGTNMCKRISKWRTLVHQVAVSDHSQVVIDLEIQ